MHKVWYGGQPPGPLLRMLEAVYRRGLAARRERGLTQRARDLEARPIVVVGNVTAGGTGKTPLVIRLCELLIQAGLRPAVVSRGYGRKGSQAEQVTPASNPASAGDEPVLIARRCGVAVFVDPDREQAARAAFADGADLVIADDGLQRWRLPRDIEICVVDGARGLGNGRLLPAGPLREPAERLDSVDHIVCHGEQRELQGRRCVPMQLHADGFVALGTGDRLDAGGLLAHTAGRAVHAVAGIGAPQRFFDTLARLGFEVDPARAFGDHHAFAAGDFRGLEGTILMTEKDAVKCAGLGLEDAWYLQVSARLPGEFETRLVEKCQVLARAKRA